MRRLLIFLLLIAPVFGQNGVRWDLGGPIAGVSTIVNQPNPLTGQNSNYITTLGSVTLAWCNSPANSIQGVACTNYATTYTDLTLSTPCSNTQQITLQNSNVCQSASDVNGNLGVNTAKGTYTYTLTSGSKTYGPFTITLASSTGSPGGATPQVQFNNAGALGGTSAVTYDTTKNALESLRYGYKREAELFNWSQSPTSPTSLIAGSNVVTLAPCPAGFLSTINGTNQNHWIYVDSAVGDAQQPGEPVKITAENCPAGNASGTITFSAAYVHGAGYSLESGTGGLKEALVDANQVFFDTVRGRNTMIEITPKQNTLIKAPLYWQSTNSKLIGSTSIACGVNQSCISIGDTNSNGVWANGSSSTYSQVVMDGFMMRPACGPTGCGGSGNFDPFTQLIWDVTPSAPSSITAGSSAATLTIPTCPNQFWPLIPNQILWLAGTSGGLNTSPYAVPAPGPGEYVTVTGGTCTPGASNGTIAIAPATPGLATFSAHDGGFTLSNGVAPYIEDNAQGTIFSNIRFSGYGATTGYGFGIQVDNDQGAVMINVNMDAGQRCDADFCGAGYFGIGPSSINSGIMTAISGTIQTGCVEWYDGNDFSFGSEVVCQAFPDYAYYLSTRRGGASPHATIPATHIERGAVNNSLGGQLGAASVINDGYVLNVNGIQTAITAWPTFTVVGSPGGTQQNYYLSVVDSTDSTKTVPVPIGTANVNDPSANNVTVKWVTTDALAGKIIQFELYRIPTPTGSATLGQAPYPGVCDGAGGDPNCLVATAINPATVCSTKGVCTFTDNVAPASLTAATLYTGANGTTTGGYFTLPNFSPGGFVMKSGSYNGDANCLIMPGPWLNTQGSTNTNIALPGGCMPSGSALNPSLSALNQGSGATAQMGFLLPSENRTDGNWVGMKGRLNFLGRSVASGNDIITIYDSNAAKTMSAKITFGDGITTPFGTVNRPQWDIGDAAIGRENSGSIYVRSPGTISTYINVLPDNASWLTRLTSSAFTARTQFNCKSLTASVKCIDAANTQGWSGSDLGAWINSADTSIPASTEAELWITGTTSATVASTQISVGDLHHLRIISPFSIASPILLGKYSHLSCATDGGSSGTVGMITATQNMASMLRQRVQDGTLETDYVEHCFWNGAGFTFSRGVWDLTGVNDVGFLSDNIIANYSGSSPAIYIDDCPVGTGCGTGQGTGHFVIGPTWIVPQGGTGTGVFIKHTNTAGTTPIGPIHFTWLEIQAQLSTLGGASGWFTVQNLCAGTCSSTQQLNMVDIEVDHLEVDAYGAVDAYRLDGCMGCKVHNLYSVGGSGTLLHQTNSSNNYANSVDNIVTFSTGTVIKDDINSLSLPATQAASTGVWNGALQTSSVALNAWDYRPTLGNLVEQASAPTGVGISGLDWFWGDGANHCIATNINSSAGPEFCPLGGVSLGAVGGQFRIDSSGAAGNEFRFITSANALTGIIAKSVIPSAAASGDIGSTSLPFANLWLGTAATNNFKFQPASTTAARVISIPDPTTATTLGLSYNTTLGYSVAKRGTAGCTTAASIGGVCATPVTVTWPVTLPNANYSVVCQGTGAITNFPIMGSVTARSTTTATVQTMALTAAAASFATIDCVAILD